MSFLLRRHRFRIAAVEGLSEQRHIAEELAGSRIAVVKSFPSERCEVN
jgi:hypothetical protein